MGLHRDDQLRRGRLLHGRRLHERRPHPGSAARVRELRRGARAPGARRLARRDAGRSSPGARGRPPDAAAARRLPRHRDHRHRHHPAEHRQHAGGSRQPGARAERDSAPAPASGQRHGPRLRLGAPRDRGDGAARGLPARPPRDGIALGPRAARHPGERGDGPVGRQADGELPRAELRARGRGDGARRRHMGAPHRHGRPGCLRQLLHVPGLDNAHCRRERQQPGGGAGRPRGGTRLVRDPAGPGGSSRRARDAGLPAPADADRACDRGLPAAPPAGPASRGEDGEPAPPRRRALAVRTRGPRATAG